MLTRTVPVPSIGPERVCDAPAASNCRVALLVIRSVPNSVALAVRTTLPPSMSIGLPIPLTPAAPVIELGFQNREPEPVFTMKLLLLPAFALLRALLITQSPVPSIWIVCGLPPPDWYLTFGKMVATFAEL